MTRADGDGTDTEPTEQDAERMSALTAEIEKRNAAAAQSAADSHTATAAKLRALLSRTATPAVSIPCPGDFHERRGCPSRRCATPTGLQRRRPPRVGEGTHCQAVPACSSSVALSVRAERDAYNHLIEQRTAFTHLTSNTDAVIPAELQTEIFTLIDNTAVLYGDIHSDNFSCISWSYPP